MVKIVPCVLQKVIMGYVVVESVMEVWLRRRTIPIDGGSKRRQRRFQADIDFMNCFGGGAVGKFGELGELPVGFPCPLP
jgi:hypothetical protein